MTARRSTQRKRAAKEPSTLSHLLSPMHSDEFFADHWERKPLVLTSRANRRYDGLLTMRDVDYLLASLISPNAACLKLVNRNVDVPIERVLERGQNRLSMRRVMQEFRAGATIVLTSLHRRWEPARKLGYELEDVFGHPVRLNAYLTPKGSQGPAAHVDGHDVFILQLEGEKRWKVYDRALELPVAIDGSPFLRHATTPVHDVMIVPGNLLYIPRGWGHEAATERTHSLHVTVGVEVLTWLDLLHELAMTEASLRRALPQQLLAATSKVPVDVSALDPVVRLCRDSERVEAAADRLRARFSMQRV